MKSQITLKDIAKMSGVSISTVSRVLNGNASKVARDSTKEKIWKIARDYHYAPNKTAQSLKVGNSKQHSKQYNIGIIFARLDKDDYNPFFIKISRTIEKDILMKGSHIEFSILSSALKHTETKIFFKEHPVDGVIILGKFDQWLYDKICNNVDSYVYVGLNKLLFSNLDQVICNGYSAAVTAVNYLHNQGHTNIMYLGEAYGEARFKGYSSTMHFLKNKMTSENVVECNFTIKSAYDAITRKYDPKYTAIFCGNDLAGIGAVQALSEMGYKIPEDVSVVSIDDIDLIQDYKPLLTTVHIPLEELGHMSVRLLLEKITGVRRISVTVEFPYQLLTRQTVKKI